MKNMFQGIGFKVSFIQFQYFKMQELVLGILLQDDKSQEFTY